MTSLAGLVLLLSLGVDPGAPAPAPSEVSETSFGASSVSETSYRSVLTTDSALEPLWSALRAEEHSDRLWYWGWAGFLGAVVVGESIIAATTSNEGSRINAYVNIPASAAGMLAVLLRPPAAAFGLEDIRRMPEDTRAQREAKAAALRALFQRSVEQQRFFRSPLNHVIGLTVNAGLAALLYFGWKLGGRALLMLAGGTIEWELQIFTRPTAALDAATATARGATGRPTLHLIPLPNGLALAGTF